MIRYWKTMAVLWLLILSFSLIGCASSTPTAEKETNTNSDQVETSEPTEDTSDNSEEEVVQEGVETETNQPEENKASNNTTEQPVQEPKPSAADPTTNTNNNETATGIETAKTSKTGDSSKAQSNASQQTPTVVEQPKPPVQSVTITITGPNDIGVLLNKQSITIAKGDTVFDVLVMAAKKKNLFVDYTGSGAMTYIAGIDNIYEFDYGAKSGWSAKLNGTTLSQSSGITKVKDGDKIDWVYLEDYSEENK